jgi:hypothetical protein
MGYKSFTLRKISSILELAQYGLLAFIFAFIVGFIMDEYIPVSNDSNTSTINLIVDITIHLIITAVIAYYIRKYILQVPFYFKLTKSYIVSRKDEAMIGAMITMSVLITSQNNFINNITLLKQRILSFFKNKNKIIKIK